MSASRRVCAALAVIASFALGVGVAVAEDRPVDTLTWGPAERIELRTAASRALAGTDITAEAGDGWVQLRGVVREAAQVERAVRIARRTLGVSEVREALRVDSTRPAPATRPDPELARAVAGRLADEDVLGGEASESWGFGWQVEAPDWRVEVDVDDGDVTLSGSVALQQAVLDAVRAARSVDGVRSVRADLRVRLDGPAPDHHYP